MSNDVIVYKSGISGIPGVVLKENFGVLAANTMHGSGSTLRIIKNLAGEEFPRANAIINYEDGPQGASGEVVLLEYTAADTHTGPIDP
jgi:hypothetical protein